MSYWTRPRCVRWLSADGPSKVHWNRFRRNTAGSCRHQGLATVKIVTRANSSTSPIALHYSLKTFLNYAAQTNLSPSSTVFRGTRYEYTCLETLSRHLGFELRRVGGAHDAGVDLEGSWGLPNLPLPLQVYIQCKLLTKKSVSPVLIRELEGTVSGGSKSAVQGVMVKVLCTPSLATKAVRDAVRACMEPVMLVSIDEQGWLDAVVWNSAMEEICENVQIGLRYVAGRKQAVMLIDDQVWEGGAAMEK